MNAEPLPKVPCLVSAQEIARRVGELAAQITADYAGRPLVAVGVLKGAWVFLADLVRCLAVPVRCDFVKLASYGAGTQSSGQVALHLDMTIAAAGQHLLVVEDIIDTGLSTDWLLEHLRQKGPASIKVCALLDKPARRQRPVPIDYLGFRVPDRKPARRQRPVPIDYLGFRVPDRFVVGYGIDHNEMYRWLPYVGYIPE